MAYLALVRHGLSEYNKKGIWTGRDDPELAPEGIDDAHAVSKTLKDIKFDFGFSSPQVRHKHTLSLILSDLNQNPPTKESDNLYERDYGVYTGKNKWEVKKMLGEEKFQKLRRGWDFPIENGESLKTVYGRVVEFYLQTVKPLLDDGENVIISSSGNVLRALVKYLENIPDSEITQLEIAPGVCYLYTYKGGQIQEKEIRNEKKNTY